MQTMRKFLYACLILVLALTALTRPAVAAVPTGVQITRVIQEEKNLILFVTATDSMNQVATQSYNTEDYAIDLDGEYYPAQQVWDYGQQDGRIHYIVCVDISGSIGSPNYGGVAAEKETIRNSLLQFIGSLGPSEAMSLLTFGDRVTRVETFSQDKDALKAAAGQLDFRDQNTQLYQAVYEAVGIGSESPNYGYPVSAVIILTDGTDEPNKVGGDQWSYDRVIEQVSQSHIPVYTVAFARQQDTFGQLRELADMSGGIFQNKDVYNFSGTLTTLQDLNRRAAMVLVELKNETHGDQRRNQNIKALVNTGSMDISNITPYVFSVNWSRVPMPTPVVTPEPTPVPTPTPAPDVKVDKLDIDPVSEDSTRVVVRTEVGAHVRVMVGDALVSEGDVNARGDYIWESAEQGRFFRKGELIQVEAEDAAGNTDETRCVVSESNRRDITASIPGIDEGTATLVSETLTISGSADANTSVDIVWQNVETGQSAKFTETTSEGGFFRHEITVNDAVPGRGTISIFYSDNRGYGRRWTSNGEVFWDIETDKVVDPTSIDPMLSEDSDEIVITTEANSEVVVTVNGKELDQGRGLSDENGLFTVALNAQERLTPNALIEVSVTDSKGHQQTFTFPNAVRATDRADITVSISYLTSNQFTEPEMEITGTAEPNQSITILWVRWNDDGTRKVEGKLVSRTLENGSYREKLMWQPAFAGEGIVSVQYSDGHGASKTAYSQGPFL
ncbi:MAG: VWA domain-containing protein, partial [Clostridia bacterium]|nr:VWA domain-containing protein [Clostridia bacterium]